MTPGFDFRLIPCPLCGSTGYKVFGRKKGDYYGRHAGGDVAQVVRCLGCSLIYANPMPFPRKKDLAEIYNEDYTRTRMPSHFVPYREVKDDYVDIVEGRKRLARIERIRGGKGLLLDIGCGPGNLLCVARDRGWDVLGLEINDESARFARETNGLNVAAGEIGGYAESWAGRFDAVHFNQVLEHTYDPLGFLKAVRRVVRPDGVIFCGVPNEDGAINRAAQLYFDVIGSGYTYMLSPTFPPYHVLGFSPRTIRAALEKTGFAVSGIDHVNYSVVDLASFGRGEVLKGLKSLVGVTARLFGRGHGLDVYGTRHPVRHPLRP